MHKGIDRRLIEQAPVMEAVAQEAIEFGPKNVSNIPYSSLNEIEQIRKTYPAEKIKELADAIRITPPQDLLSDDVPPTYDLYNPLLCAYLTADEAQAYLAQHAEFYGTEPKDLSDLDADENGNYVIAISGHRRKRAIELLAFEDGLDLSEISVSSNLRAGITFEEALVAQIRENTYENVPPEEFAKQIEQLYEYLQRQRHGVPPTQTELSRRVGVGVGKISSSLQFMRLPEDVRGLLESHHDLFSYSCLLELEPLMQKYGEHYDALCHHGAQMGEKRSSYIYNHLWIDVNNIVNNNLSPKKIDKYVKQAMSDICNKIALAQPQFDFAAPIGTSIDRRRKSMKTLATTAFGALSLVAAQDPTVITNEQIDEAERLLAKIKTAREMALAAAELQEGFF